MLKLSLVTPSKKFLTDAEVEEVFVPAYRGELNILEGHAPLMSTLDTGILRYRLKGEEKAYKVAIHWGYLEISHDRVTVLAETAENPEMIDVQRAQASRETAEKAMQNPDIAPGDFERYQLKIRRSMIRLQLAGEESGMNAAAEKAGGHGSSTH